MGVAAIHERVIFTGYRIYDMQNGLLHIRLLLISSALVVSLLSACREPNPPHTLVPFTVSDHFLQKPKTVSSIPKKISMPDRVNLESAVVTRVIDGDTIEVSINGKLQTVRYIGIDTPETKHPSKPVECFGTEAARFNEELVAGRQVLLEKDMTDKDRYGRLLRYLWIEEVGLVNRILVDNGYARVSTYLPDVKSEALLIESEVSARIEGRGLWGACSETRPNDDEKRVVRTGHLGGNCSPAYPTLCLQSQSQDLDCHDINAFNFLVLEPDPHRLDGDGDGIGCER